MKRYFIFITSFILLYMGFQILPGMILTALYTPNFSQIGTGTGISQVVEFGQVTPAFMPLLTTMLLATSAYFLSQRLFKTGKN